MIKKKDFIFSGPVFKESQFMKWTYNVCWYRLDNKRKKKQD